jgi:hypothetical protein
MNPDRIHPEARIDFFEAIQYYDSCQTGLAAEFVTEIERAVNVIDCDHDCGSPSEISFLRELRVKRFPYSIIFDSQTNPPFIIAIYHERRRPGGWAQRLS